MLCDGGTVGSFPKCDHPYFCFLYQCCKRRKTLSELMKACYTMGHREDMVRCEYYRSYIGKKIMHATLPRGAVRVLQVLH